MHLEARASFFPPPPEAPPLAAALALPRGGVNDAGPTTSSNGTGQRTPKPKLSWKNEQSAKATAKA